jgi:perosamine synthetase
MNIGIAKPYFDEEEKSAVLAVLENGQLAQGSEVEAFEHKFAAYHGARHGIAINNGTTALIATLMAHDIGAGDEVIIPSFSFFATASAVLFVNAVPVFVDIDPRTYCLSPNAVLAAITPRTAAVLAVHLYGLPADIPSLSKICSDHGLLLLEDAAQAHGAAIGEQHVGASNTASFSFYPSKNMTTGEGGMVLTSDDETARRLRMIRNQGMNEQYCHEVLGFNFRMTNMAAALGRVQLRRLPAWNTARSENAAYYNAHLQHIQTPFSPPQFTHVYHQYTVRAPEGVSRDSLVKQLNERGIGARVYYPRAIHQQPVIQKMKLGQDAILPETEKATQSVLSLPVHPALTSEQRDYIVEEVNRLCC